MVNQNRGDARAMRTVSWRHLARIGVVAMSVAALGAASHSDALAQNGDSAYPSGGGTGIFGEDWPFPNGSGELVVDDWPFPDIPKPGSGGGISVGGSSGGDINVGGSSGGNITMGGGGGGISIGGGSSGSGSGGGSGSGSYG